MDAWIEMPAVGTGAADDLARSKYRIRGNAFLVHHAGKIYAKLADELEREEIASHGDCRRLSPSEALALERNLPFRVPQHLFSRADQSRPLRLGDVIAWVMEKLGIAECGGCQQRKTWLNGIVLWGWLKDNSSNRKQITEES
jgi:hypothetical protein